MVDKSKVLATFEAILKTLLKDAHASRTTLRIDLPQFGINVNSPAAEALGPGVPSLKGKTSLDQRKSVAFGWLDKHRRLFIENDCATATPDMAPEPEVTQVYGIRSEMLGPIIRNGQLAGVVSVHDTKGPHPWTKAEQTALEAALKKFHEQLDALGT